MEKYPNYSSVRLLTNAFSEEGVTVGSIGYIIEVYGDEYEVEFSDADGITIAQIVVAQDQIELSGSS
jgi:hypothetical protein